MENIKQSKLTASAQNTGNKSSWRAIKALYGDSIKPNETEPSVEVSYNQLRAQTDMENAKFSNFSDMRQRKNINTKAWS